MTQTERRRFLIDYLLLERRETIEIPPDEYTQKRLLRSLLNLRLPKPLSERFLTVEDAYLQEEIQHKGITDIADLSPIRQGLYVWQGDITTLKCDAIVNAANAQMLGCFYPCHGCIDNAIHTFSGTRLRQSCHELMEAQGHEEPTGSAKITPAYNLPCRYVIHTVGPIVSGPLTEQDCTLLRSCYLACLQTAADHNLKSIAFCCISTGEFHFPREAAAKIAVDTVLAFQQEHQIEVIFNVFKDEDNKIYRDLLSADGTNQDTAR